jgi:hypothetical protein
MAGGQTHLGPCDVVFIISASVSELAVCAVDVDKWKES